MTKVLMLYASTHGHTGRIASRVARVIEQGGATVELRRADGVPEPVPGDYDAVVVGASIHAGHHQRLVTDWARRHATSLSAMPSAFFSVSLAAADDTDEAQRTARAYVDDFVERTGWSPRRTQSFAGALQYREYDVFTRLLIKLMMHRGQHPTDTSRDYDYTDWEAVDAFAQLCAELVPETVAA